MYTAPTTAETTTPGPGPHTVRPAAVEPSVVVVGNGAAGTLLVISLLRAAAREHARLRVSWIGDEQPGRGVAYSTPRPWHRVNAPAASMSLGAPSARFEEWLAARGACADEFPARWGFGTYLTDVLAAARRGDS
ncbi:MAG TPA: FAD/NAD(P)-binding protein [Pseudonocardia sp.]|jgi:uncharacterized NAD(P)/FAD-binding protein YdhS